MLESKKIFVAGHQGLVGSAIVRKLKSEGYEQIITRKRAELDLTNQAQVSEFFASEKPAVVFLAAAKVGGILANSSYPADFIRENLQIQTNVIDAAHRFGTERLIFLGSSCIYPKFAPQPMKEEHLLTSSLEPTNEAYAIAKIAGLKMCQFYFQQYGFDAVCAMPTNLYGPNDNFDLATSHVLPALIRKFHEAQLKEEPSVQVWGSGNVKREFLYVDDLAEACVFLMKKSSSEISAVAPDRVVNVGVGKDISIRELAALIGEITEYQGNLVFDATKPDGTPQKLLDVSRINSLGWSAQTSLTEGIRKTYEWYKQSLETSNNTEVSKGLEHGAAFAVN